MILCAELGGRSGARNKFRTARDPGVILIATH
jgi:hypothetical protein